MLAYYIGLATCSLSLAGTAVAPAIGQLLLCPILSAAPPAEPFVQEWLLSAEGCSACTSTESHGFGRGFPALGPWT